MHCVRVKVGYVGFPRGSDNKESAWNAGDLGSIPGLARSPGGEHGTHSSILALRIPIDRGARWIMVRKVANGRTPPDSHLCRLGFFPANHGSPRFQGVKPSFPGPKDSRTRGYDLPGAPHGPEYRICHAALLLEATVTQGPAPLVPGDLHVSRWLPLCPLTPRDEGRMGCQPSLLSPRPLCPSRAHTRHSLCDTAGLTHPHGAHSRLPSKHLAC